MPDRSYEAVVETVGTVESGLGEPLEVSFTNGRTGLGQRFSMEEFTGGHLLHLAVAGCVFNDLVRESRARGITLTRISVTADGGFQGSPTESTGIEYRVDIEGQADEQRLRELVAHVADIAEIPAAIRKGAQVQLSGAQIASLT